LKQAQPRGEKTKMEKITIKVKNGFGMMGVQDTRRLIMNTSTGSLRIIQRMLERELEYRERREAEQ